MKKTALQLREERQAINIKIDALMAVETRSTEQETELNGHYDAVEKLGLQIDNAEREEKRQANIAASVAGNSASKSEEKEARNFSFGKLAKAMAEKREIEGFELEIVQESAKEARNLGATPSGIYLSNKYLMVTPSEKRTMTVGTTTAGGNLIATEKIGWFDELAAKLVLSQMGATMLNALSSNTDLVGFATGVTCAWGLETADATSGDPTTASRSLTPKRLAAYVDLSKQLLIQDNTSIEAHIMQSFIRQFAIAIETAAINGSGSGANPLGLLNYSPAIGSVAIGSNGGTPTLAKILEIVQTTETNNAGMNGKWLTNPKVVAKLKQTSIDAGSGAMIMSYGPYFGGVQEQIDGKPVFSTSVVPSNLDKGNTTGVCSALIYGDWENLVLGQFGGVDLTIDNISQAIGGKNRIVMNQYWNFAVKQSLAFTACKDLTTT